MTQFVKKITCGRDNPLYTKNFHKSLLKRQVCRCAFKKKKAFSWVLKGIWDPKWMTPTAYCEYTEVGFQMSNFYFDSKFL